MCLLRCPQVSMPYPPDLGLGYIRASLSRAGYEVRVLDLNWDMYRNAGDDAQDGWAWRGGPQQDRFDDMGVALLEGARAAVQGEIDGLLREGYNAFGFSVWHSNRKASLCLARWIKERAPGATIIFGGPDCQPMVGGHHTAREECVDAIVFGDGEETIVELIRSMEQTGSLKPCPGAWVRVDGSMVRMPRRALPDPAKLPHPDFHDYRDMQGVDGRIAIAFNRGCVRKCRFCSVAGRIPRFRSRPAESILDEMKHQSSRYGIREFFDFSPAMNSDARQFQRLCELMARDRLDIRWHGWAMISQALTDETIQRMRAAGCFSCSFCIESGSQRVLDLMGKRSTVQDAERILKGCAAAEIRTIVGFVVGFIGETERDFLETMDFLKRNAAYIDQVGAVTPLLIEPYSPIHEERSPEIVDIEDHMHWYLRDLSNTPAIRQDRVRRLTELAESLGLFSQRLERKSTRWPEKRALS